MQGRIRVPQEASHLEQLQSDDFIMDANVEEVLEEYLKHGGDTATAINALAQGYIGRAQICNIITTWLSDLGSGDEGVACIEKTLASQLGRHFEPDRADRIFAADGSTVIEWLPKLVQHRRWRKVIYDLVQHFPQCLMLNFAVRLISDAGFQSEISNVNTATQQLEIFSRVMVAEMRLVVQKIVERASSVEVERAIEELVRVISQTEHTFLYTIALLESVARRGSQAIAAVTEKGGRRGRQKMAVAKKHAGMTAAVAMYISQRIRASLVGKEHETVALRCGMLQSPDEQVPGHVITSIITMTSKGFLNPADVNYVYQDYIMPRPPPVALIRDETFITLLLDALFVQRINEEHRDKYIYLLAYACTVGETLTKGQRMQTKLELDSTRVGLEKVVCSTEGTLEEFSRELPELLLLCRLPAVAAGLLHYVRSLLMVEERVGELPAIAFVLLDHISSTHPNLQQKCFQVVCELYDKVSSEAEAAEIVMQRQRAVVDRFVHLFLVGSALVVLEKMSCMFAEGSIDASIIRYFVMEILEVTSPPYTTSLSRVLLPLVTDTEIIDIAFRERTPAVTEFIDYANALLEKN